MYCDLNCIVLVSRPTG